MHTYLESERNFNSNLQKLINGDDYHPHGVLGLHPYAGSKKVIRIWRPGAETVYLEVKGKIVQASKMHEAGIFEYVTDGNVTPLDYRIFHQSDLLSHDPYAFAPTFGVLDQYLFGKGVHYELYRAMGARLATHQGASGVKFAVWAPGARRVSVISDLNHWDGRVNPMRSLGECGVWELFIPGMKEEDKYKFEIKTQSNELLVKADPYAYSSQLRPLTASVVANIERFKWQDQEWTRRRFIQKNESRPINIYEVHLGSWKRKEDGSFLNYRELARELVHYCREMGFTHIELMPIQEHPLDESWGYQVTGFYAVSSRYGAPEDFQWFVNHAHLNNIGMILDWVPGHFPTDNFSLARFDGTALYEHEDPRKGFHPHWSTLIFNFGRHEVSNFLIANALFWFEQMHIDGLRVDAVASMLYLDYGREEGQWIPNQYGAKDNLEAIEFLKHMNSIVHQRVPGIMTIAEESTSYPKVTYPVEEGGLGFDMKWNMGWMNDTLRYFSKDMIFRHYHQNDLTFGLIYAFSERFALVLSHDEVVHGKKNLLAKMPGDMWQQFANLRLLISYMICQPGKKLLFMGGEIGQWNEWWCKHSIEWDLLRFPSHQGVQNMVKELNHFYLENNALWIRDFHYSTFEWVDFADRTNSMISYLRKGPNGILFCVHNFTPTYHPHYVFPLSNVASIEEVFNTDAYQYGGSGKINSHPEIMCDSNGFACNVKMQVAPLATSIFKVSFWT